MLKIKCFWLEPADQVEESLRRFKFRRGEAHLHDAERVVKIMKPPDGLEGGWSCRARENTEFPRDHPYWPKVCACGYEFQEEDEWQYNLTRLYTGEDGESKLLTTLSAAPVGAMWDADWFFGKGPDGKCLMVRTPAGDWNIDGKSEKGGGWTRTGTPPDLTVTPSIGIGRDEKGQWQYHGWLRDGYLVEC